MAGPCAAGASAEPTEHTTSGPVLIRLAAGMESGAPGMPSGAPRPTSVSCLAGTVEVLLPSPPASSRAEAKFSTGCSKPSEAITKRVPVSFSITTWPGFFQSELVLGLITPRMPNAAVAIEGRDQAEHAAHDQPPAGRDRVVGIGRDERGDQPAAQELIRLDLVSLGPHVRLPASVRR